MRLGLPYLVYVLLWPLLLWLTHLATGQRMSPQLFYDGDSLLDYAAMAGRTTCQPRQRPLRGWHLVVLAAGITVFTFVVRIWLPANGPEPVAIDCVGYLSRDAYIIYTIWVDDETVVFLTRRDVRRVGDAGAQ